MNKVCIVGGTSVDTTIHLDRFPEPVPQTLHCTLSYRGVGSTGAGKAFNLKPLGIDVTLHTVLGRDPEGQLIRDEMRSRGISLLVDEVEQPTEQHVNIMVPGGQRMSLFTHPSPDTADIHWPTLEAALKKCDIAVVNILSYARPVLAVARRLGKPIWTDLHDYDGKSPHHQAFLDAAEAVFLSSDSFPGYRAFMESTIANGKRFVVCTHGKDGATLLDAEGNWIEQPPFKVAPVDTNGAGDAFFSGFLFGYLLRRPYSECMALAAKAGALCVTSRHLAAEQLSPETLTEGLALTAPPVTESEA